MKKGAGSGSGAELISRLDRIPIWPFGSTVLWVIGMGFLVAFYDITNVSFALPKIAGYFHLSSAASAIPVTASLLGYILGSYLNSTLADLKGRRTAIISATILFTVGSLATTFSFSYGWLIVWRFVTGMGIGAEIAAISTYIGEMAPAPVRGRYTGMANIWSFTGLAVVPFVALGLLTHFSWGWRGMFFVGALAGLTLIWAFRIPESPRWLIAHDRLAEAEAVIQNGEARAEKKLGKSLPAPVLLADETHEQKFPTSALFRPPYLGRWLLLFFVWVFMYLSDYAWLGMAPTLLVDKGYSLASSTLFLLVTGIGYPIGAILSAWFGDRFERKYSILVGIVVYALSLAAFGLFPSGATIVIAGFILSVALVFFFPLLYALTAESFPTQARATGVSLTDGIGHVGGALAPIFTLAIYAAFGHTGFLMAFMYMALTAIICAILLPFGVAATRKSLEVVHHEPADSVGVVSQ
ncbi:MFS transporter [Sulfobacillus harzensis]|uniref:MFS transporter n=1 Tax=Sulfobacillus harzensis TaxID=2729629 RepID=A0A7Y0Q3M7_9FIRM|nr:MFS transporter [Sulfobacillus harzensis]NMP23717.1 MFS transporter [Sulfobacillus harzensis]